MFRSRLRIPRLPVLTPRIQLRRSIHYVPELKQIDPHVGIPELMSPAAFEVAWTDYMRMLMQKINMFTAGTNFEDMDLKKMVLETARESEHAALFNAASASHNNHFFFKGLSPKPTNMSKRLETALVASFGSVQTLRDEMYFTAMSMTGPGFVWLVKTRRSGFDNYAVLVTYLAGSPYAGAHWRQQGADMNMAGASLGSEETQQTNTYMKQKTAQMYLGDVAGSRDGRTPTSASFAPGGIDVVPLLCVNTWEHVWLLDHGLFSDDNDGKAAFLYRWWDHIDWAKADELAFKDKRNFLKK